MKQPNKTRGTIMAGVGLILIIIQALNYILHWGYETSAIGIIGIVFVVIGMNMTREKK
jgi:hypothetical protein